MALGVFGSAQAASAGDLNGDGKITAADARLTLRAAVGLDQLSGEKKTLADVNQDGKVNAADARKILRAAVWLEELNRQTNPLYAVQLSAYKTAYLHNYWNGQGIYAQKWDTESYIRFAKTGSSKNMPTAALPYP